MKKFFTKIAGVALGLAMAIGVGVAVASSREAVPVSAANSTYNKVSLDDIAAGDQVLIVAYYNSSTWYYLPSTTTSSAPTATSVTISNNTITADLDSKMFTVGGTGTSRTFSNGTNYLANTDANNGVRINTTTSSSWTITATTNGYKMTNNSRWLGVYNGADWRSYTTSNANNYKDSGEYINFYKKAATKTLSSITLSGYTTEFTVGDNFLFGGTVTAHYSNSTTATVTASTTFSGYNMNTAGNYTVTASYTEGGVTKTATYSITVSAPSTPFITLAKSSTSGYTGTNESLSFTYGNLTGSLSVASSNTSVVTVGTPSISAGSGTVQINFVAEGSTTVKFKDGSTELASVSVSVTASSVTITGLPASKSIANGGTFNLGSLITVTALGSYSSDVTWESDDDSIVSVTSAGVITGESVGTTDVTVTSDDYPSATMTCSVTVANMISAVFGSGTTDGSGLASDAAIKAVTGYTVDNNLEFSSIAAVYGSQGNALKLGTNSAKGTLTIGFVDGKVSSKNAYITKITVNAMAYGTDSTSITINGTSKTLTSSFADYDVDVTGTSTTSIAIEASTASKQRFRIQYINVFYDNPVELSSVSTSGEDTLFTAGNNWSYGGTLTAHYSDSTFATKTPTYFKYGASGIDPTSAGTSITTSTTLTKAEHDGKYIYVIYTEDDITKYCSYQITVNYAAVTSVVIGVHAAEIGLNETYNDYLDTNKVSVTINSQYANQGYEWIVSANTVNDEYAFDESGLLSGDTEGTITLRCRSTSDNSKYDELVVTVTGDPTAAFTPESVSGYVGKGTSVAFTYGNMDDTSLIAVSSSSAAVSVGAISASNDNGTVAITFVSAGTATLSISYNGGSVLDTVTVTVSADSVVALNWTASNIKVYSGEVLPVAIEDTWMVNYEMASGDTDFITYSDGDYSVKLGGSTITLPHTWVAADDGKTLCVEYGGVQTSTVSVDVTQSLQDVNMPNEGDSYYQLVSTDADLEAGRYLIVSQEDNLAFNGSLATIDAGQNHFSVTINNGVIADDSASSGKYFDLTVSGTAWTITSASGSNVAHSGSKNGMDGSGTNTISISNGVATIAGSGGKELQYNYSSGSSNERFRYYTSGGQHSISLFKLVTEEGEGSTNIANVEGHEAAQKAVVAFAKAMNAAFDNTAYCTEGVAAAWATASSAYSTNITNNASLSADEKAYAKNLIKYASAQYTDDTDNDYSYCLERAMATYEACIQKHGQTAFMSDVRSVSAASRITSLSLLNDGNSNAVVIIVIISMISVTAIGGHFFLRKRKEQ